MDPVARAAEHVDTQFFRAIAVLRAVTLVFAVGINAARWRDFDHPSTAWALIGVMIVWSGVITWFNDQPERRSAWICLLDMAVTIALLRTTPYVESNTMMENGEWTLTTYWVIAPVLSCAVRWGAVGGLLASIVMQAADVTMRPHITSSTIGNVFLMVAAALLIGYCAQTIRVSAIKRTRAERMAALAAERERLARVVHDGVLQVLALVQRRGAEIGGDTAELGRLAGEQEVALRALVQSSVDDEPSGSPSDQLDLGIALNALSSPRVTVSTPGRPVVLPRAVVSELVAVALACQGNTVKHTDGAAHTWILLEDENDRIVVSIRDDGPGMSPERISEAESEGRMGISKSIRGRVADLGGTSDLVTAVGQGTEWEFVIPRDAADVR